MVDKTRVGAVGEGERETYEIVQRGKVWDLSKVDFEKLRNDFNQAEYRNIEIADLWAFLEKKLDQMLQ